MNKFEKYCWNKWVRDSFFGARFKLNEEWIKFITIVAREFGFKKYKYKNVGNRIMNFMGIYK